MFRDFRKPRYTRELIRSPANRRGIRLSNDYYARRRFEFYRAGFKTIRLPGTMGSPTFLAAFDIARICQVKFTPAVKHPDWAAKIKALSLILFGTPEFGRLKPQTINRYRKWLDEFCYQIGGRLLPTMRYIGIVRSFNKEPRAATLRKHCRELRDLLERAANLSPHSEGYQPRPVEAKLPKAYADECRDPAFVALKQETASLLRQLRDGTLSKDRAADQPKGIETFRTWLRERKRREQYPSYMRTMMEAGVVCR